MSGAEYLAREYIAESRSEFLAGEVRAMSGASWVHNVIVSSLHDLLGAQLRGHGCRGVSHDLRVRVEKQDCYFYPDFVVICGPPELIGDPNDTLLNPRLIVEVLSPTTEAYDRGAKFFHYQQIPSLQQYVLVSQDRPLIEVFTRQSDGLWRYQPFVGLEITATFSALEASLPLAELYRDVTFPT
jgi:Uma2 family endonuclease